RLNADYTQRVNRIHGWDGPVFRGRFRSELVRDESSLPCVLDLHRGRLSWPEQMARRSAVWALCQRTDLTHGAVGRTLRMTAAQVASVLRRFDRKAEPMRAWCEAWEERLYDK
ncbi:MAG: hypothetical protein PHU25_16540, partial [Deltaproteobacteria bacterium]|nr:hypothetical protein [Deltaproteobacteria bacterium]